MRPLPPTPLSSATRQGGGFPKRSQKGMPAPFYIELIDEDKGFGLKVASPFHAHQAILAYRGKNISNKEANGARNRGNKYLFDVRTKSGTILHVIDASDSASSSACRYVNQANDFEEQNCVFRQIGTEIVLFSTKPIQAGEELLAHYGQNFFF